ncbi:hypothetical protein M413DRAFT_444368 [Hebeloma cylindrosporum]|uniref:Uncharacterized protein n=1 Tax=Hebeloma cylindrosporum TaxID=76867 RepID=A0A0C3C1F0_HEBCY|nr:hypothetical protein M413DRAFT_444368 [Hebeloma cylindrosporum h7]
MASVTAPPPSYNSGAPPTYEDFEKEVERLKQKAASDPTFKQNVKESFIKGSGSDDNLKIIREGVDLFTQNITKINSAFDDIRVKLYEVDKKELKDRTGTTWKGESKWNVLRDEWKSLLRDSQDTALKSVARCDEFQLFCEGVMKITSLEDPRYRDTITELENFIQVPDPVGRTYNPSDVEKQAMTHSEAFQKLKEKLTNFKADFGDFADYQKVQIKDDLATLNRKISDIEIEIKSDETMILSLGVALGVTIFSTLAGGVVAAAMGPLSPLAIIALVIGSLLAIGEAGTLAYFIGEWYKKTAQRDKWKDEVKGKEALEATLVAIVSKLENQETGLGFILTQVDLLKNVWHTISNEAYLIANMLKDAKDKKTLTYFQDEINHAKEAYKELSSSLAKYSRAG